MKKIHLFSICALGIAAIYACSSPSESYHSASIANPSGGVGIIYADQTEDTIQMITTDNWEASSATDWITVQDAYKRGSVTYEFGYFTSCTILLNSTPNTTGSTRTGIVNIALKGDDFNQTMGVSFFQYPVLNVSENYVKRIYPDYENRLSFYYQKTDTANCVTDTIAFDVHNNWTLTVSDAVSQSNSGIGFGKTVTPHAVSGEAGYNKIPLTLIKNTSTTDNLETTMTLTSGAVSTPIKIIQQKQEQKQKTEE